MIPASYVKPYVARQKNDAADAAAICEAVTRPAVRTAPIKSVAQQAARVIHELLSRQRVSLINAIRVGVDIDTAALATATAPVCSQCRQAYFGPPRYEHAQLRRDLVEPLGTILADLMQRTAQHGRPSHPAQ